MMSSGKTDYKRIIPIGRPISATVFPPGSKSITNRALVTAALAPGTSTLTGGLVADDTGVMMAGLSQFGVTIDCSQQDWSVQGVGNQLQTPKRTIDAEASGTTFRFLSAVAALAPGKVRLTGTPRMQQRPIKELAEGLSQLGVGVETRAGFPPIQVSGGGIRGGEVTVDSSRSSQFLSALLMVAPWASERLMLRSTEPVSAPYIQTTLEVMRAFSAQVEETQDCWLVEPTGYQPTSFAIEPDASAAVYPLVAAAVTGGTVTVQGIPPASTQADLGSVSILEQMGCRINWDQHGLTLTSSGPPLKPVEVDMNHCPDAVLAVAVAALFAQGPSRLCNIANLRLKETDRLTALVKEINRVGGRAQVEVVSSPDGSETQSTENLIVEPRQLQPAYVETYQDHRMAMAFALVGLVYHNIYIVDPGCVSKTWPRYFDMLESLRSG